MTEHPVFGNVEKTIDRLVKELYLEKLKDFSSQDDGPAMHVYRAGPRTEQEIDNKQVLSFLAQIMGTDVNNLTYLIEM